MVGEGVFPAHFEFVTREEEINRRGLAFNKIVRIRINKAGVIFGQHGGNSLDGTDVGGGATNHKGFKVQF